MKVLITGVTGRVGRHLARELLARGDEVIGTVLPGDPGLKAATEVGVRCIVGDLSDRATVDSAIADAEAVVHLAAVMLWGSEEHNPAIVKNNIDATFQLVDAVSQKRPRVERFIFASSDEVYPSLNPLYRPIDENHPRRPYSVYGLSKSIGEDILHFAQRQHALPTSIARFALVASKDELLRHDSWLGRFLFLGPTADRVRKQSGDDAADELLRLGPPETTPLLARDATGRPYTFHYSDVRDTVAGLLLMLDRDAAVGETFNLSGPSPFSYDQVIPYLAEALGVAYADAMVPGPPIHVAHSTAKARALLGYVPKVDVFQAIREAVGVEP